MILDIHQMSLDVHQMADALQMSDVLQVSGALQMLGASEVQFNQVAIQTISVNEDLLQDIKLFLLTDTQVEDYLQYLQDLALSRFEDVQEYLTSFHLQDDLLLRHDLDYISDQDRIKLRILQSLHDSRIADHLDQVKILELVN